MIARIKIPTPTPIPISLEDDEFAETADSQVAPLNPVPQLQEKVPPRIGIQMPECKQLLVLQPE